MVEVIFLDAVAMTALVFPSIPLKLRFVPSTVRIVDSHANHIEIVSAGFMIDQFVRTTKVEKQLVRVLIDQVTD